MASLAYGKQHRLRAGHEFRHVFQQRNKPFRQGIFTIRHCGNSLGYARLGCAVSRKNAGNAVRRNLIRRVIKESFRIHLRQLGSNDYVVTCRAPLDNHTPKVLAEMLLFAWEKLADNAAEQGDKR